MECLASLFALGLIAHVVWTMTCRAADARRLKALDQDVRDLRRRVASLTLPPQPESSTSRPVLARPPREDDYAAAESELRDAESVPDDPPAPRRPVALSTPAPTPGSIAARGLASETGDARPAAFSLEDFLGGRVLLVVGVVVVLFALGFFLKLAIEQDLIAPVYRVAIGGVAGIAALIGGDALRRKGLVLFGHGVMGGGLGALFISVFFAATRYELIPRPVAFAVTALIGAAGVALALRREAPLLAYLGFLGGYLAPAILGENRDALEGLVGWLLLLHGGLFVCLMRRRWVGLDVLAVVAGSAYYGAWWDRFLVPAREPAAGGALALLTLATLALALLPGLLRRRALGPSALGTAVLTGCAAAWAAFELFHPEHRLWVGVGLLTLAAAYAIAAWRRRPDDTADAPEAAVLDGAALASFAGAVPAFFEGAGVAPVWAVSGALAVVVGANRKRPVVAAGGLVMVLLAQVHLFAEQLPFHDGAFIPFVNGEFPSWASPSIALVVAGLAVHWRSEWTRLAAALLLVGCWAYAPVLAFELGAHFAHDRSTYGANSELYSLAAPVAALAAYGAALAIAARGRRVGSVWIPGGPLALSALLAAIALFGVHRDVYAPVLNAAFGAGLALVAAFWLLAMVSGRRQRIGLVVVAALAGLVLVVSECVAYGEYASIVGSSRGDVRRTAHVWLSVCGSLYGAALLVAGFVRRVAVLRWCGLAVFLLTLLKVFLVDMAQLPTAHRIGGFLVLGLLLLGASFLYQRARTPEPEDSPERSASPEQPDAP